MLRMPPAMAVELSRLWRAGDHGNLVLEVHDNGRGVPKRDHNLMWNRFERGAHRFNAAIPGSGIGLSVVAAITEAHGGVASYRQSERLGGACFFRCITEPNH